MRARSLIPILLLVLFSCAEAPESSEPEGPPVVNEEPDAITPTLEDSTCENTTGGNPENFPRFTEVELETGERDRITFTFEPDAGAPDDPPLHFINFAEELITDGEGRTVKAEGEAFVVVSFQAVGVDLSGEKPVEVYTGEKRFKPAFGVLREVVHLGDFEGQVSWGLGLARESCFSLDAGRDHITLEFPNV
jgi:hypothetical protein